MKVINGLGTWKNLSAFNNYGVVGSKVVDHDGFTEALKTAIAQFDWANGCDAPGQAKIKLPASANGTVSCGEAAVAGLADGDLFARIYRGVPTLFAHRSKASEVKCLEVIVYTKAAWDADKDDDAFEEVPEGVDHVIVAVLASPTEDGASYSPTRLAHNLAGGNNAFQVGTGGTAEQVLERAVEEAKKAIGYARAWLVVYG